MNVSSVSPDRWLMIERYPASDARRIVSSVSVKELVDEGDAPPEFEPV